MTAEFAPIVKLMADLTAQVNAGTLSITEATRQMPEGLGIELNNDGKAVIVTVPKNEAALTALIAEYDGFNAANGLNLGSADEHINDPSLTEAQRQWLRDFCVRWDKAAS